MRPSSATLRGYVAALASARDKHEEIVAAGVEDPNVSRDLNRIRKDFVYSSPAVLEQTFCSSVSFLTGIGSQESRRELFAAISSSPDLFEQVVRLSSRDFYECSGSTAEAAERIVRSGTLNGALLSEMVAAHPQALTSASSLEWAGKAALAARTEEGGVKGFYHLYEGDFLAQVMGLDTGPGIVGKLLEQDPKIWRQIQDQPGAEALLPSARTGFNQMLLRSTAGQGYGVLGQDNEFSLNYGGLIRALQPIGFSRNYGGLIMALQPMDLDELRLMDKAVGFQFCRPGSQKPFYDLHSCRIEDPEILAAIILETKRGEPWSLMATEAAKTEEVARRVMDVAPKFAFSILPTEDLSQDALLDAAGKDVTSLGALPSDRWTPEFAALAAARTIEAVRYMPKELQTAEMFVRALETGDDVHAYKATETLSASRPDIFDAVAPGLAAASNNSLGHVLALVRARAAGGEGVGAGVVENILRTALSAPSGLDWATSLQRRGDEIVEHCKACGGVGGMPDSWRLDVLKTGTRGITPRNAVEVAWAVSDGFSHLKGVRKGSPLEAQAEELAKLAREERPSVEIEGSAGYGRRPQYRAMTDAEFSDYREQAAKHSLRLICEDALASSDKAKKADRLPQAAYDALMEARASMNGYRTGLKATFEALEAVREHHPRAKELLDAKPMKAIAEMTMEFAVAKEKAKAKAVEAPRLVVVPPGPGLGRGAAKACQLSLFDLGLEPAQPAKREMGR